MKTLTRVAALATFSGDEVKEPESNADC